MDLFGVTAEQSVAIWEIYEELVAGDVRHPVARCIVGNERNLAITCPVVSESLGLDKKKGEGVGRWLSFVAVARDNLQRALGTGITDAKWMSGDWTDCCTGKVRHASLDGKRYKLRQGLKIGNGHEIPGVRPGCKCGSQPVVVF